MRQDFESLQKNDYNLLDILWKFKIYSPICLIKKWRNLTRLESLC